MKTLSIVAVLLLLSGNALSQSPMAAIEAIWEDLFRGTLTENRFSRLDSIIARNDPNGKYPEWKLQAITLKGWYAFEYENTPFDEEQLISAGNVFLDATEAAGKGIDRKEWVLAKANFYEWAGRVTKSINDDKYRTLLYLHQAYTIKRRYFGQNHPEVMRLLFFFALHHVNLEEAVEISHFLYETYQTDTTLKADPFAAFYDTSLGFYEIQLVKPGDDVTQYALNIQHREVRERAYLNLEKQWAEDGVFANDILSTLVKLLRTYGPEEKYTKYAALFNRKKGIPASDTPAEEKAPPPNFGFAYPHEFHREPETVLQYTHAYMAYHNPLIEANDVLTPYPGQLPPEMLEELASFWAVFGQKTYSFGRAFLTGNNFPGADSLKAVCGWAEMCQYMILHLLEKHQIRDPEYFDTNMHRNTFKEGFRAGIALYQQTGERAWLEKAYSLATFGKNFRLYALHLTEERFNYSEEIKALSAQIQKQTLAAENFRKSGYFLHFDSLSARYAQVFQLVKQQDSLLFRLREKELSDFSKTIRPNLIGLLQEKLKADEAMLEFFPDPFFEASHGALLVKKDTAIWHSFPEEFSNLQEQYEALHASISARSADFESPSRRLYDALIAPFEKWIVEVSHLYLLPNEPFTEIPFGMLLNAEKQFLSGKYSLAQHFNARLLAEGIGMELKGISNFSGFAPFGLKEMANGENYPAAFRDWLTLRLAHAEDSTFLQMALPASHREVNRIAAHYPSQHVFTEKLATENQFKSVVKQPGILHLASHAVVDREDVSFSRLLFYPSEEETEDGALHLYELPYLKINSPLVVLSACQTGVAGEGWLNKRTYSDLTSLAYGFYVAGVPNQLVSLWNIADEPSAYLMERFHFHLAAGKALSEALKLAQADYRSNPEIPEKFKHPYYWAGYQLIGTNQLPDSLNIPLWLVFTASFFAVSFALMAGRSWMQKYR